MRLYCGLVHKDKGSDYGVSFPDFPGCVTVAGTLEEAHVMAQEALQLHVDGTFHDGESISQPTDLERVHALARQEAALTVMLVPVRVPGVARTIRVSIEEELLEEVDRLAKGLGLSRSAVLAQGVRRLLAPH